MNRMTKLTALLEHAAVGALDVLVKVVTWGLSKFTRVKGGTLLAWHRGYADGRPWVDAWWEPQAWTLRLWHYELIIDLAA